MPKYRQKYGQFTVEGRKGVDELIHSRYDIQHILVTKAYITKNEIPPMAEIIDEKEMQKLSSFSTAPGVLAVANTLEFKPTDLNSQAAITLCLDGISDPGNLGTIIRTADWFGIHQYRENNEKHGWYSWDARISYNFTEDHKLSFLVENLTNTFYTIRPALPGPTRSFSVRFDAKL